jgi:antitoxin VapB
MSLNIKDPEAHRLARAIAQATGQSMTRVVTDALRERYAQLATVRAG